MTEPPARPLLLRVDDDPVVRLTLARALTDRGYEVRTAADGQAAITILEGSGTLPAITITDLQMTGGSGEELARTLTRRYPDLPLIFMTAIWHVTGPPISPGPSWRSRSAPTKLCELIRSVLTAASELRATARTLPVSLGQRRQASPADPVSAAVKANPGESPEWLPHESRRRR